MKETFGLGKEHTTEGSSQGSESTPSQTSTSSAESSAQDTSTASTNQQGQFGYNEIFSKLKSTVSSASPAVSSAFQKLKESKVSNLAKKGFEIVRDELSTDSKTRTKKMQQAAAAAAASGEKSTRTEVVVVPTKRSILGEKWEALKQKVVVIDVLIQENTMMQFYVCTRTIDTGMGIPDLILYGHSNLGSFVIIFHEIIMSLFSKISIYIHIYYQHIVLAD